MEKKTKRKNYNQILNELLDKYGESHPHNKDKMKKSTEFASFKKTMARVESLKCQPLWDKSKPNKTDFKEENKPEQKEESVQNEESVNE